MRPIIHRILWFLLDIGAPGQLLMHGWQIQAARQLGIHRITLRRQVEAMIEKGLLVEGAKKGEVMLNLAIFTKQGDSSKIRMMKAGRVNRK